MKRLMCFAGMLLLFGLAAYPQTDQKIPAPPTKVDSTNSLEGATPKRAPNSSLMHNRHQINPACTASGPINPCGAMSKLHHSFRGPKVEDLTVSQSQLVSTSTPLDRNEFDLIGARPIAISPEAPDMSVVNIGGVETIVKNPTPPKPSLQSADSASGPTITSYSPGFGNPGTVVTITGTGFGAPQTNSFVDIIGIGYYVNWPYTTWSDTQIVVSVPSTMQQGKVYFYIVVNGTRIPGSYPFTVGIPPTITSYSPGFGLPGTLITIKGTGFGPEFVPESDGVVALSSITNAWSSWAPASWSDTEITVNVPSGFPQGKVYLSVLSNKLQSYGTDPFTVGIPPEIDCYNPGFGPPGTLITLNGKGFGSTQGSSSVQVIGRIDNRWRSWPVVSWSDTQVVASVPADGVVGYYYLSVVVNNLQSSGSLPFQIGFPPVISNYSPGWGNPGTQITINGSGFGQTQGTSRIQPISSVTNTYTVFPTVSWSDTQVVVTVPQDMPIGKVYLLAFVGALESYGTFPFDVGIPPQITSYSPNTGPAGTVITINGTGFGETQGSSYALLQSVTNVYTSLTVLSWSDTQVTVSVPKLTPHCLNYLTITVGGLQTPGTFPFQVVSSNNAQAQIALQPNSIQTNVQQSPEISRQPDRPPKLR